MVRGTSRFSFGFARSWSIICALYTNNLQLGQHFFRLTLPGAEDADIERIFEDAVRASLNIGDVPSGQKDRRLDMLTCFKQTLIFAGLCDFLLRCMWIVGWKDMIQHSQAKHLEDNTLHAVSKVNDVLLLELVDAVDDIVAVHVKKPGGSRGVALVGKIDQQQVQVIITVLPLVLQQSKEGSGAVQLTGVLAEKGTEHMVERNITILDTSLDGGGLPDEKGGLGGLVSMAPGIAGLEAGGAKVLD